MSRSDRESYGLDAPAVPVGLAAVAAGCGAAAVAWRARTGGRAGPAVAAGYAAFFAASASVYLHTTLRGKFAVWADVLDDLDLRGDERVLDLGCGRGAVLIAAARRLPRGYAVGVDLWRAVDQSGNSAAATLGNARAAGVADRVQVRDGDLTALPFGPAEFDLVLSALAIHNLPDRAARDRAVTEAVRVLRPGGRLVIADFRHTAVYAALLADLGLIRISRRSLGPRYWYGGPWAPTWLVTAVAPDAGGPVPS